LPVIEKLKGANVYKPIAIDSAKLEIIGVPFPDKKTFECAADAIGSNMFEGFEPTPRGVALIRDYVTGKIDLPQLIQAARESAFV